MQLAFAAHFLYDFSIKVFLFDTPSIDKVSLLYLFSFPRYQTNCVIEFLFRQLKTSWTLGFVFDHTLKQWSTRRKRGEDINTKNEYLEIETSFLDEIKSIVHSFWRVIIWWKNKKLMEIADTSFKMVFRNYPYFVYHFSRNLSFWIFDVQSNVLFLAVVLKKKFVPNVSHIF